MMFQSEVISRRYVVGIGFEDLGDGTSYIYDMAEGGHVARVSKVDKDTGRWIGEAMAGFTREIGELEVTQVLKRAYERGKNISLDRFDILLGSKANGNHAIVYERQAGDFGWARATILDKEPLGDNFDPRLFPFSVNYFSRSFDNREIVIDSLDKCLRMEHPRSFDKAIRGVA